MTEETCRNDRWRSTIEDLILLADYVEGTVSVDFNYALTTLLQLRANAEVLSHHFEDSVWAKFDEVEHLIRENCYTLPLFDIERKQLQRQLSLGIPHKDISKHLGVSLKTVQRRIACWGLRRKDLDNSVSDEDLDVIVSDIHHHHPNTGYKMILGHLRSRKILVTRRRVLASLRRVDPQGIQMRRFSLQTTRRRRYFVPAPNSMWHIDGNHKLIRWRVVVHGGIDGFSRLIVYLTATNNNRAQTVLESFMTAVQHYGIPSRVRSDKGGENILVARFMVAHCGLNRRSHIAGRSVHNQSTTFLRLEAEGWLSPDKETDLYALHRCYMPHIQSHLQQFLRAWNNHSLRSARNQSPVQLWLSRERDGSTAHLCQAAQDCVNNWRGPPESGQVYVPELELPRALSAAELATLPNANVPLTETLQVYIETVSLLREMMDR
ncbi:uncharacterized protein LOC109199126 isoform X2 [Oreochromis niloticus]|uniref:uncharacterized protein LOC109194545 isoform X2 n=1 Tax=Oreochromis niloticus TaxID=8128 RepID=UPI00090479AB|nr:uncharacterized protein LOC109194545 isoform X2 [Oreochromis niloticus]XP_019209992.1 uncharacterized protein LOC109199125 isoform X2 [Oreochromis niloticus]XP_019209995.1 uncharacterized protein LOC109199126 isoform X2 [Oreochromis niloticus]CAI5655180.1 unnamed protein product [Mustela putorius furo]